MVLAADDSTTQWHGTVGFIDNARPHSRLLAGPEHMAQYIYTMNRVSKVVPPEADHPARHQPVLLSRARRSACSA